MLSPSLIALEESLKVLDHQIAKNEYDLYVLITKRKKIAKKLQDLQDK